MTPRERRGLISPRTAYAVAAVLEVAGVLALVVAVWPGVALIGAGLLLQWRAGVAQREAVFREWNDEGP